MTTMTTFDAFRDAVVAKVADLSGGSQDEAEDAVWRGQSGGVFNDHYDEPESWSDEEAAHVAERIVSTLDRSAAFMREAAAALIRGRFS